MTLYQIQYGDTLTKIAKEYNTTVEELRQKNNIDNPNSIMAGTTIDVGENLSNFDNYELKTGNALKYSFLCGAVLPLSGHVTGAVLGKIKDEVSSLTPEQKTEAKEKVTNKTKSFAKGALIGTACFPGLGTIIGGIVGWFKG